MDSFVKNKNEWEFIPRLRECELRPSINQSQALGQDFELEMKQLLSQVLCDFYFKYWFYKYWKPF